MTRFQKYLNEDVMYINLSKEPKDNTIGTVDPEDPEFDDIVHRIKNTVIGSTLREYVEFLLDINSYYSVNENSKNALLQLVQENFTGDPEDIEELKKIDFYELSLDNGNIDSVDNIAKKYSEYLDANFFRKLSALELQQSTAMGKGEIVLGLYTQLHNTSKEGDLETEFGDKVEVKKATGRLKGDRHPEKKASQALEELKDEFNIEPTHKGIGAKMLDHIINSIDEKTINDSDRMKTLIKILQQYPSASISSEHVSMLQDILEKRDKKRFYTYMLALHLDAYKKVDAFQYFLVFDADLNKFIIFDVMQPFSGIYKVAQNLKLAATWYDKSKEGSFQIIPKI